MVIASIEPAQNYYVARKICVTSCMRGFTSTELYSNQEFYAFNPYVRENAHIFRCDNIAFSASVSDSALGNGYNRKDPSSRKLVVQRKTIRNAKSSTHAVFLCLLALLSVTWYECLFSVPRKVGGGEYILRNL